MPTPRNPWKKINDSTAAMMISVMSNAAFTVPTRTPLTLAMARTTPSPGTTTTFGASSMTMPKANATQGPKPNAQELLPQHGRVQKHAEDGHAYVDHGAEQHVWPMICRNWEGLNVAAQQHDLKQNQQDVPDSECGHAEAERGELQAAHVRRAGDGRGAQISQRDQCHTERVDDDAQGEEHQTLRHVAHMVRLLFFRILVPAFCGTAPQAGPGREPLKSRRLDKPDTPDVDLLNILLRTPPPLFPRLPASSRRTREAMHAFPPNPNRRVPAHSLDPRNRRREYNVAETKGDHMLLAALGVLTRIVTPLQTVVNARLRGTSGHTVPRVAGVIHRGIGSHNDCGTAARTVPAGT